MTHGCDLLAKQLVLALHVPKSVHQSHFNKANVTQLSFRRLGSKPGLCGCIFTPVSPCAFTALTPLVGRQEEHRAGKIE